MRWGKSLKKLLEHLCKAGAKLRREVERAERSPDQNLP